MKMNAPPPPPMASLAGRGSRYLEARGTCKRTSATAYSNQTQSIDRGHDSPHQRTINAATLQSEKQKHALHNDDPWNGTRHNENRQQPNANKAHANPETPHSCLHPLRNKIATLARPAACAASKAKFSAAESTGDRHGTSSEATPPRALEGLGTLHPTRAAPIRTSARRTRTASLLRHTNVLRAPHKDPAPFALSPVARLATRKTIEPSPSRRLREARGRSRRAGNRGPKSRKPRAAKATATPRTPNKKHADARAQNREG